MSEPENFLSRWSRRKREPEEVAKPAADVAPQSPAQDKLGGELAGKPSGEPVAAGNAPQTAEAAFDPATLPPLDSIGAETDISAFLKANVPSPLRLAALRRAWLADPAIRDFKGMAEYDWDFTAPDSMRGFGNLDPGTDVQKMLTEMFGDKPAAPETISQPSHPPEQIVPQQQESRGPLELESDKVPAANAEAEPATPIETADKKNLLQREENIAAQNIKSDADESAIKRRRSQGSALPQ